MTVTQSAKLMELYAACPECGCAVIGNGKGTLECDTGAGYFKRACSCGWYVEVREVMAAPAAPEPVEEDPPVEEPSIESDPPIEEPTPVMEEIPLPQVEETPQPWKGFVHIRCEACHKETTTCLRTPTTSYTCKECGHEMELPKAYRAYTHCECGQRGRYLTNIPDWTFDIPCVGCGSPNTVTYNPGKDCYGPVGSTRRRTKPRKKN